jgi:pimeloyl-ACP methyl ester carboxylesterase
VASRSDHLPEEHLVSRPGNRAIAALVCAGTVLPLAACGTDEAVALREREQSTSTDVPFTSCDDAKCTGELDGAAYEIRLPDTWNGTLLIYSHGYRQAEPSPPDFDPVDTTPAPAPSEEVGQALLDQGYALAGSAFKTNGWDVLDGVKAGEALHDYFVDKIADPDRTYVWGDSLGGLITQTLAEKHPEWVSGAAPLCGVLAGGNLNLDLALDVAYAVKTLIYPDLKLTGFASHDEAVANWQGAYDAITQAGSDLEKGVPSILLVAALVDAPSQTRTYDGSDIESQVRARAESILTALGYGTYGRYDIEQRVGGNPSGNEDVDYSTRVSEDEQSLIDTVSPGATRDLLAVVQNGERVSADSGAREAFGKLGDPTGQLKDPTITLHTSADPLVLVQNESVFRDRVYSAKDRTGDLVQLYTMPPASYSTETGAPYGAGHCNFTTDERTAVISILDDWVRKGQVPGAAAIKDAFGTDPGLNLNFFPGEWPAEGAS